MAPFSNYISFIFLTTLLLPLQITARDSQFFSKVTHFNNENNNNNNVKETEFPNKEEPVTNKPEKQPAFIPEKENSYGLYGHDSGELPYTKTNDAPYTTPTTYNTEFQHTNKYPNKYYNNDAYNTEFYNKDAFGNYQNELSDTKYTEEGHNSMEHQNNNQKYYFNNNAANERSYYNNNNRYNGEKVGMSDTRFLEGGKYYYDLNSEKYNPSLYGDSSKGVNTNNWYNNRGNNYGNYNAYQNYGNNNFQNQEEFEDEQDNFEPWTCREWRIHFTFEYLLWVLDQCFIVLLDILKKTQS